MGCLPGEIVTLELIAPLGDPIAINIGGYLLSLRKQEAQYINVQLKWKVETEFKMCIWLETQTAENLLFSIFYPVSIKKQAMYPELPLK